MGKFAYMGSIFPKKFPLCDFVGYNFSGTTRKIVT